MLLYFERQICLCHSCVSLPASLICSKASGNTLFDKNDWALITVAGQPDHGRSGGTQRFRTATSFFLALKAFITGSWKTGEWGRDRVGKTCSKELQYRSGVEPATSVWGSSLCLDSNKWTIPKFVKLSISLSQSILLIAVPNCIMEILCVGYCSCRHCLSLKVRCKAPEMLLHSLANWSRTSDEVGLIRLKIERNLHFQERSMKSGNLCL